MRTVLALALSAVLAAPVGSLASPTAAAAVPLTAIWLDGEPSDPILSGATKLFTTSTHAITLPGTSLDILATSLGPGPSDNWRFVFRTGVQPVAVGTFEGAQDINKSGAAIDVGPQFVSSGNARGRFIVHELVRNAQGFITTLSMSFTQHADWRIPALHGEIRINSTHPLPALTASPATQATSPGGPAAVVSIMNPGSAPMALRVDLTGRDPADFRIASSTCPATLPAAASCEVTVVAEPVGAGSRIAEILIRDGTLRGRRSVSVSSNGLPTAALVLSTSSAQFLAGGAVTIRAAESSGRAGLVEFRSTSGTGAEQIHGSAPVGPGAPAQISLTLPIGVHWITARLAGSSTTAPTISRPLRIVVLDPAIDTTPPSGIVVIAGGASTTTTRAVSVGVPASDAQSAVTHVALSNSGTSWTTLTYAPTVAWTLTAGDGTKTVWAKWRDSAGNWSDPSSDTIVLATPPPPPPADPSTTYTPMSPVRLLDTRTGNGLSGRFVANTPRTFQVTGRGGIPADAVAITANLTVVGQTAGGYVSLTTAPTATPKTSTLNVPAGDVRANNVTIALGTGGTLSGVYKAGTGQSTHLLLDVTGYFRVSDAGSTYHPLAPVRLLDSRSGNGVSGAFSSGVARQFTVAGRGGVPAGAVAVTGNLTIVGQTGAGYASLAPSFGSMPPATSTINAPVGDVRANGVTVALSATGKLSAVYVSGGVGSGRTAHLLFDVTGYYTKDLSGFRFVPITAVRALDTRNGTGLAGAFTASTWRTLGIRGTNGIPTTAGGITGNLTEVGATAAGYVTMSNVSGGTPTTSTINFPVGDVRANGVTGALSGSGAVSFRYTAASGAKTHLVLDVTGYFR